MILPFSTVLEIALGRTEFGVPVRRRGGFKDLCLLWSVDIEQSYPFPERASFDTSAISVVFQILWDSVNEIGQSVKHFENICELVQCFEVRLYS